MADTTIEQAVLGGILLAQAEMREDLIKEAMTSLNENSFSKPENKAVFAAMVNVHKRRLPIDIPSIDHVIRSTEKYNGSRLESAGGLQYIASLVDFCSNVNAVRAHIGSLCRLAEATKIDSFCRDARIKFSQRTSDDAFIETMRQDMKKLVDGTAGAVEVVRMDNVIIETAESTLRGEGSMVPLCKPSISSLSEYVSGWCAGRVTTIAARPAMGKTAFAYGEGQHIASTTDRPVLYISAEMQPESLAIRAIVAASGVDRDSMVRGIITKKEEEDLIRGINSAAKVNANIWSNKHSRINIDKIGSLAWKIKAITGKPLAAVVVDYLQILDMPRGLERERAIAETSREQLMLAQELDCAWFSLSQLNRKLEERDDKRPMLSDLRESGSIEQDSEIVVFLYRDEVYNKDTSDAGMAELIVAKNRNGKCGTATAKWDGRATLYRDVDN